MRVQIVSAALPSLRSVVKPGDRVVVLTDWKTDVVIPEAVCEGVAILGGEPCLISYPPLAAFGNEPPEFLQGVIAAHDAMIACTSTALTHTNLVRTALASGVKYLGMAGLDLDMFRNGACLADYNKLYAFTKALSSVVESAQRVRITSEEGTDLSFTIAGRPAFCLAGLVTDTDPVAAFPDGEVACAPVEGSANGVAMVNGSMHGVGTCVEAIRIDFENGFAVNISGGVQAHQLKQLLARVGDSNSFNLAEFAIGTNPMARMVGSLQEDKKALGTIHIAIGDNCTLGGVTESKTHLDGVVLRPSIWLDNMQFMQHGEVIWSP